MNCGAIYNQVLNHSDVKMFKAVNTEKFKVNLKS